MKLSRRLLAALACCSLVFLAGTAGAQQAETKKDTEIRNFEVISVDGNKVVYRSDAGIKEATLPPDFKMEVDGKQVGVADIKPGMKGKAVITTTYTIQPVTVTEVRNAKVLATAGNAIIVRGQDGVKKFTLDDIADRNITIMRDGQRVDMQSLRVGDELTATIVTRHPPKVMTEREVKASASSPAPAPAVAQAPAAAEAPAPAPRHEVAPAPVAAHAKMPKTGSRLPLLPLGGAAALLLGSALTLRRRLRNAS